MDDSSDTKKLRGRLRKISEAVAQDILLDIVKLGLRPGDKLPQEAEMRQKYNVARSTIREALRILEISGTIALKSGPGGGPTVRRADPTDLGRLISLVLQAEQVKLKEVLEARRLLEPIFIRQATRAKNPEFLEKMRALKKRGRAVDVENERAYLSLTGEFHELATTASANPVLTFFVKALMSMFVGKLERGIFPPDQRRHVLQEHEEVIDAVLAGKDALAEQLMAKHMNHFLEGISERQRDAYEDLIRWE